MDTENVILQLPGSMEGYTATSADVAEYVETPSPTPDNVPQGLVYTQPQQNVAPKNAVEDFVAAIESIWTSAAPILQTVGVIPNQNTNQQTAAQVIAAQQAAANKAEQQRMLVMLAVGGVALYLFTR